MFHVGQMVVCVDDSPATTVMRATGKIIGIQDLLEKNRIYTIRRLDHHEFGDGEHLGVWLEEVVRNTPKGSDIPFGACRFRPVKETSIDCFTALLTKPPAEERV